MRLAAANSPIGLLKVDAGLRVRAALGAQGMTLFSPIERAVRIRTGKTDKAAVQKPSPTSLATRRETMESGTYARQRLVSVVAALLGTAILFLSFADIALAPDPAPPACGGKILEKCTPNSCGTPCMLTSVPLALMMPI